MKRTIFAFFMAIFAVTSAFAQEPDPADASPDKILKTVVDQAMVKVRTDPKLKDGDVDYVVEQFHDILDNRFDFRRMTVLAMGRNWRLATATQQNVLVSEFRQLLIRTYSKALGDFRDDVIEVLPLRAPAGAKDVVVKTQVNRRGQQPVPVDYSVVLGKDGVWRCFDIVVGGVSLVTSFRDEFNNQVQKNGVDGLIQTIAAKNQ